MELDIPAGRRFEHRVLGVYGSFEENGRFPYMNFVSSLRFVINYQPEGFDPLNPKQVCGKELLHHVREALGRELKGRVKKGRIRYIQNKTGLYTCLDTSLDYYHGADAIIACDLGRVVPIFTIDLTMIDDGEEFSRTNHVRITPAHFDQCDRKGRKRIVNVAGIIAEELARQIFEAYNL